MKISEVLAQDEVSVVNGAVLAQSTVSVGYAPSFKDTVAIAKGKQLFRIVGVGEAVEGVYSAFNIVPIVLNEDATAYVNDTNNPVVKMEKGKVTYVTGRNHPISKDIYQDRQAKVIEDVPEGEEARQLLLAFVSFVRAEYGLGVNDFTVETPEYTAE